MKALIGAVLASCNVTGQAALSSSLRLRLRHGDRDLLAGIAVAVHGAGKGVLHKRKDSTALNLMNKSAVRNTSTSTLPSICMQCSFGASRAEHGMHVTRMVCATEREHTEREPLGPGVGRQTEQAQRAQHTACRGCNAQATI